VKIPRPVVNVPGQAVASRAEAGYISGVSLHLGGGSYAGLV